jgi:hypothetical protein
MKNIFLLFFLFSLSFAGAETYKIQDLGTLHSDMSYATCINEKGQVVGSLFTDKKYHFLWDPLSGLILLEANDDKPLVYAGCGPFINDLGEFSQYPINNKGEKFLIENERLFKLLPSGKKVELDSTLKWHMPPGLMISSADNRKIWEADVGLRVNEIGLVLGLTDKGPVVLDTLSKKKYELQKLFETSSKKHLRGATHLNDKGEVTAWSEEFHGWAGFYFHSYTWTIKKGFIPFNSPVIPCLINNLGKIIGFFDDAESSPPTPWNISVEMQEPWASIEVLMDINDEGKIVGWGKTRDGHLHAVLLVPSG